MLQPARHLLVLSLSPLVAEDLADFLREEHFTVTLAGDADAARAAAVAGVFDLVVLDCASDDGACDLVEPVMAVRPDAWVVALALGGGDVRAANLTFQAPFDLDRLVTRLRELPLAG